MKATESVIAAGRIVENVRKWKGCFLFFNHRQIRDRNVWVCYWRRMNSHEIIDRLKSAEPALRATGVASLRLFGSYARNEAREDSDIDLFAEGRDGERLTLIHIAEGQSAIQALFPGKEISFSSKDSISPLYLPYIEASSIRVF